MCNITYNVVEFFGFFSTKYYTFLCIAFPAHVVPRALVKRFDPGPPKHKSGTASFLKDFWRLSDKLLWQFQTFFFPTAYNGLWCPLASVSNYSQKPLRLILAKFLTISWQKHLHVLWNPFATSEDFFFHIFKNHLILLSKKSWTLFLGEVIRSSLERILLVLDYIYGRFLLNNICRYLTWNPVLISYQEYFAGSPKPLIRFRFIDKFFIMPDQIIDKSFVRSF